MVNKLNNLRKIMQSLSYEEKKEALKMIKKELKIRFEDKEYALKWWYKLSTHKKLKLTKKYFSKGVLEQKKFQNLTAKDVHKIWLEDND